MKEKTAFQIFLEDEVSKVKGVYYPVRAGLLRRIFIKEALCSRLHPNPNDEFCLPEIGPNYEILSDYTKDFRIIRNNPHDLDFVKSGVKDPILVEKTHPEGYMILNGHHRWAAAHRAGMKKVRIKIVDLTQEKDIRKMLRSGRSDRRATLDLDEVIFRPETDPYLEKPLRFPMNRLYRERLRRGIPALFLMLNRNGYDIWIYTASYYSLEYLQYYFKHYHIHVTGIVTGTARKTSAGSETRKELETLFHSKYKSTIHIDNNSVIRTFTGSGSFEEFRLSGNDETWAREVADVFEEIKKK